MAKLINPEYDHHYLSFTQATRLFSAVQSYTFEESKDRDFVHSINKASEAIQVTKLRTAVKQLIDMADLQPVYEITSTLALVNPRYEFNQLMGLLESKHVDELSDDLAEQVQAFRKFYESIISDEHVKTVANGGTLATPFMKYLTPADFQRAENGEIDVQGLYVNSMSIASPTSPLSQLDGQVYRADPLQVRQTLTDNLLQIDQIADMLNMSYKTVTDLLQKSDLTLSDAYFVRDNITTNTRLLMAFDPNVVAQQLTLALQRLSNSVNRLSTSDKGVD